MNVQNQTVMAPPAPKGLAGMQLPMSMMRDILIKTMFRMNIDQVRELSKIVCLPIPVTQELIDMARSQLLLEAMGTLNANSGSEMGYQLTDAGKARALDALAQSEYFGAMPIPLDVYREQVKARRATGNRRSQTVCVMRWVTRSISPAPSSILVR